jgi:two-component system OmpR family response regulator
MTCLSNASIFAPLINQNMRDNKTYTVALVDDNKMFLDTLKASLLTKFGKVLSVYEYDSGEACIQNIDNHPDIVVLDYYLNSAEHPDAMNGIKLLKEIKSHSKDIMVIMLSGQDTMQVAIDAIKHGAYDYIAKSESAFIRIQNTISNGMENISSARKNGKYFTWNISLAVIILLIVTIDFIWYNSPH